MAKKYTAEAKTAAIREMLEKKRPVTHIARDLGISKSRLYAWSEQARHIKTNEPLTPRKIHDLQVALRRAEQKLEVYAIAQYANCGTRHEKLEEIESILKRYGKRYSRHLVCEVFGVNRTTLVNHLHRGKRDAAWWVLHRRELAELVMGVFAEFNSCCGAAKITQILRSRGYRAGMHTVAEIMQERHLYGIRQNPKRGWTALHREHVDLVQRKFNVSSPNRTWFTDFVHVQFKNHIYSVCVILDGFARRVVGFGIGRRDSTRLLTRTFKAAYESRSPEPGLIFHSDNGAAMSSDSFRRLLVRLGVNQSFSRPRNPRDNAVIESFNNTMKREDFRIRNYSSLASFKQGFAKFIEFYNERRPHKFNKYLTPSEKEAKCPQVGGS